jgi:predicted RNase H-like HicB family nuclease
MKIRVVYEKDGGSWHVYAPDVPGCRTHGRSISAARTNIREALGTCVDVLGSGAASVARTADLVEEITLPKAARHAIDEAVAARRDADTAALAAQDKTARAARALTKKLGLSLRDAGDLLGLSHERVKQLTAC